MKTPEIITVDGKIHHALKPKAILWRDTVTFDKMIAHDPDPATRHAEFISKVFADVSPEDVLKALDIDELKPMTIEIMLWVMSMINNKLKEIPNAESPVNL